jgi:hypothetical protein
MYIIKKNFSILSQRTFFKNHNIGPWSDALHPAMVQSSTEKLKPLGSVVELVFQVVEVPQDLTKVLANMRD